MRKKIFLLTLTILIVVSCKTKPPTPIEVKKPEIVFIQVTDRGQISYSNLKFTVVFSDGSIYKSITDIEGKAIINPNPDISVLKIIYDFSDYKRPEGRLLAKEDFKFAKKVKTKKDSDIQEFELNLSAIAGAKTILILDSF